MAGRAPARGSLTPESSGAAGLAGADPGLFGPGSEAWALDREAWLLLGAGPRALLLQLAHPIIAEGVDQHSDLRADPWSRLAGTLRSYLAIVYGSTDRARAELRRLNRLHASIGGPVRDPDARAAFGATYAARDPGPALWVHATLVDSTLAVTEAWLRPLPRERRARFHDELRAVGLALGIPNAILPANLPAFEAYWAGMLAPGGPIRVTETARALAPFILRPPLGPAVPGGGVLARALRSGLAVVPAAAYAWTLWPAVGLLPPQVRDGYGLAWGARERFVAGWLVAAWRAWAGLVPAAARQMPAALAADRRVRRRGPVAAAQ